MASSIADSQGKEKEETYSEKFAALLTGLYAEQQAAAAEKCGVSGGESWRVAFESASNSGARQVCTLRQGLSCTSARSRLHAISELVQSSTFARFDHPML